MLEIVMKQFRGKSTGVLRILLDKKESELEWGKKTNMIGSGRIHDLNLEIAAIKALLKKH